VILGHVAFGAFAHRFDVLGAQNAIELSHRIVEIDGNIDLGFGRPRPWHGMVFGSRASDTLCECANENADYDSEHRSRRHVRPRFVTRHATTSRRFAFRHTTGTSIDEIAKI
jgi:hypothetical protein